MQLGAWSGRELGVVVVLPQGLREWAGSLWKLVKMPQSLVKMTRMTFEGTEQERGVWKGHN